MATPKKVVNVPEVDKAKRDERDKEEMQKFIDQLTAELETKKAELEAEMRRDMEKYMTREPELEPKRPPVTNVMKPVDYTEIPNRVYKKGSDEVAWRKDPNNEYRLTRYRGEHPNVGGARAKGWRPLMWADSFQDTDHYEKTPEGYVLVGDCIIMYMSKPEYIKRIKLPVRERLAQRYNTPVDMFREEAEAMSREVGHEIEVVVEKDGENKKLD